jgi:flagellar FliL protein
MKKLILYGGIAAGLLVVGVVLALFVLGPIMGGSSPRPNGPAATAKESDHGGPEGSKTAHGAASEAVIYSIEDIVINPAGTGGSRFLSVSFGIELGRPELEKIIESRDAAVRDALITILSSKTVAQLTDSKQKEITRYQIKKRVEQILKTKDINNVYYTDFVLQ